MTAKYFVAEGLEARDRQEELEPSLNPSLRETLDDLVKRAKEDPQFAMKEHYILFCLNAHRSLIKADLQNPPQFWIINLDADVRAALQKEQNVIKSYGHCVDVYDIKVAERQKKVFETITGVHSFFPVNRLENGFRELASQKRELTLSPEQQTATTNAVMTEHRSTFFQDRKTETMEEAEKPKLQKK